MNEKFVSIASHDKQVGGKETKLELLRRIHLVDVHLDYTCTGQYCQPDGQNNY